MTLQFIIVALLVVAWVGSVIWRNRPDYRPPTDQQIRSVSDDGGMFMPMYLATENHSDGDAGHHAGDGHDHGSDFSDSSDAGGGDGGGGDGGGA